MHQGNAGTRRGFTKWVVYGLLAALVSGVSGQCHYYLYIIEGPECPFTGPAPATPMSLNEAGDVVGYWLQCSGAGDEAFWWTADEGMMTLSRPDDSRQARAFDINDAGQVVGRVHMNDNTYRAALWHNGDVQLLEGLPKGTSGEALSINNDGQIAGCWLDSGGVIHGFLWENGQFSDLGELVSAAKSRARGISSSGVVCGWFGDLWLVDGSPCVWREGRVVTLPSLDPDGFTVANSINAMDLAVGQARFAPARDPPCQHE